MRYSVIQQLCKFHVNRHLKKVSMGLKTRQIWRRLLNLKNRPHAIFCRKNLWLIQLSHFDQTDQSCEFGQNPDLGPHIIQVFISLGPIMNKISTTFDCKLSNVYIVMWLFVKRERKTCNNTPFLSVFIFCYFLLLIHYISGANIVLFTPLHLFDSLSYFVG